MAAHAGPVGAFCDFRNGVWPASVTSQNLCWQMWNNQTGTTAQAAKIFYYQLSQFPTAMDYQTTAAAALGIKAVVCVKPDYSSTATMTADLAKFTTMVNMFQRNGLTGWIVMWQEPQNVGKTPTNPTGPQFVNLFQFDPNGTGVGAYHAAANAAGFGLIYDAVSHSPSLWAPYMPGGQYLDAVAVDYYCDTYLGAQNIRIHGTGSIMDLADQAGLPFGIFEIGVTAGGTSTQPTQAQMQNYLNYLIQIMGWNPAGTVAGESLPAGRLHQGKSNAPVMWYNGQVSQTLNQVVPLATATYSQAPYCVNTGYPNLWQALQPQSASTLTITTTSLPNGVSGVPYSAVLHATGGATPYTWAKIAGSLPAGLSLTSNADNTATISGTPS